MVISTRCSQRWKPFCATLPLILMMSLLVTFCAAHPAATSMDSSTENEISDSGEDVKNNNDGVTAGLSQILITPLSGGDFTKAAGVLATIASSIENQISMPGSLMAEEALIRMQQVRPMIDEAFHRFAQDVEKWSRQHPAESRQLFTIVLPAIGLAVAAVAIMSVMVLGFSYVTSSFGLTSISGLLSGLLAGRSLPMPGADGMLFGMSPEALYNVGFWKELDTVGANPAVLQSVFDAIEKFNKMQDEKRSELAGLARNRQSHQNYAE